MLVLGGLVILSFHTSVGGIVKADMFPPQIRALGVGLAHATASAAFGGSTEYLALLMKLKGVEHYFFYYAAVLVAVSIHRRSSDARSPPQGISRWLWRNEVMNCSNN